MPTQQALLTGVVATVVTVGAAIKIFSKRSGSRGGEDSVYVSNVPQTPGTALFVIDPQNDFMDQEGASLAVTGAVADSKRTASFLLKNLEAVDEIFVSLDSHARFHIAHADFWLFRKQPKPTAGQSLKPWEEIKTETVVPFTEIPHASMLDSGLEKEGFIFRYEPKSTDPEMITWCLHYTKNLEKQSSFVLMTWPFHCLIGSKGHNIHEDLWAAIEQWELLKNRPAHMVLKGKNSKTEHYSAFKAEVVVLEDPATGFNEALYNSLNVHNRVYVAGQARSHCVNHSVRDFVGKLQQEEIATQKVILLEGSMSDVTGSEAEGDAFWSDMVTQGVTKSMDITKIYVPAGHWSEVPSGELENEISKIDDEFDISENK